MIVVVILILAASNSANAADTKINGLLFTEWRLNTSEGSNNENEFGISRAYITVKSKLSEYSSVRITTDIRNVDNFDGYTIVLKYGYFDWKPQFGQKKLTVRFGLQPTPYTDIMNKFWGRRYMLKTASDEYKFLTTSDLGTGFIVDLGDEGKLGTASIHIFNGTSYTDVHEMNTRKDLNGYLMLQPFTENENLKKTQVHGQFYSGTQNVEIAEDENVSAYKKQIFSIGGVVVYQEIFDFGLDLNFLTEGQGYNGLGEENQDLKSSAHSIFATLYLNNLVESNSALGTLNIFGRYDIYDPDTGNIDDSKNLFVVGIECAPVNGFKASLNYLNTSFDNNSDSESSISVNTLFQF